MLLSVKTSHRCGNSSREVDDRGIKGILGEFAACLSRFRLHAAEIGGFLVIFFDKILKLPTMNSLRRLAEVPKANQSPKIPFIPRSSSPQVLIPRQCEVCTELGTILPLPKFLLFRGQPILGFFGHGDEKSRLSLA